MKFIQKYILKSFLLFFIIIAILSGNLSLKVLKNEQEKKINELPTKNNLFKLLYNQKETFPDQYNPPTNSTNLETANFTATLLSSSLSESDPTRKLRFVDFLKLVNFVAYRLTRGESEQIFLFADKNRDGLLDHNEWDTFVSLYIMPFEACDKGDRNYLLDENEFKFCFDKDPKFKFIIFPRIYGNTPHKAIMKVLSTRQYNLINFHEYLFIKRATYGWNSCQSNAKYIAKAHFSCALKTALSFERKYTYKLSDDEIYNSGLRIDNDHEIQHNFISYMRILYYFNIFNIYSGRSGIAILDKSQLIKSIREDRLPNNIEESEADIWYDLISSNPFRKADTMAFPTFVFFYNLHRLFNRYSKLKPNLLNKEEVLELLQDNDTPHKIVHSIDSSHTNFNLIQYQEASLTLQRLRPNESSYFVSFLSLETQEKITSTIKYSERNRKEYEIALFKNTEKVENKVNETNASKISTVTNISKNNYESNFNTRTSEIEMFENSFSFGLRNEMIESLTSGILKSKVNSLKTILNSNQDASANSALIWNPKSVGSSYYEKKENKDTRNTFFTIFKEGSSLFWNKSAYYRAFALGNLFVFLMPDDRFVIPSTIFVDKLISAYSLSTPAINSNQRSNYSIYKNISRDISLDILIFFSIENYHYKLKTYMNSSNTSIPETIIKLLLQDFGMRLMPDTVLDLGKKGSSISKQRMYDLDKTMQNAIYVQSIACENENIKKYREESGLITNLDPSRRYPAFPRRAMASPLV